MGVKKVSHIADMPTWFNLKKYETTSSFTVDDWISQLSHRLDIQWHLNPKRIIKRGAGYRHMLSKFDAIKENPTLPIFGPDPWVVENEVEIDGVSAFVQPLKCGLAHALAEDIEQYYGLNERGNLGLAAGYSVSKFYKDSESYMAPLAPVVIDLYGSDVDIKKDFNRLLEQVRAHTGIESKKGHITPREFEKLQDYNILPYSDLMIWCAIEGRSISANVILNVLFAGDSEIDKIGEPFIHKTLKPFYQKLNNRFLRALERYQQP
jgi:hypothetical protein